MIHVFVLLGLMLTPFANAEQSCSFREAYLAEAREKGLPAPEIEKVGRVLVLEELKVPSLETVRRRAADEIESAARRAGITDAEDLRRLRENLFERRIPSHCWSHSGSIDSCIDNVVREFGERANRKIPERRISTHGVIVDNNVVSYMSDPASEMGEQARQVLVRIAPDNQLRNDRLWVTATVQRENLKRLEAPPLPRDLGGRVQLTVSRESERYRSVRARLDELGIGRKGGSADRDIVADAFFTAADGDVPTLVTADTGIVNKLCNSDPRCQRGLQRGTTMLSFSQAYPDGYTFGIQDSTNAVNQLKVVAVARPGR